MNRIRPRGVNYLIVICFLIGGWNLIRFIMTLIYWNNLSEYKSIGSPLFIAVSGAAWMVVAFLVGLSIVQAKPWAWGMSFGLLTSYGIWTLFEKMFLQTARVNKNFELIITIIWLIINILVLSSHNVRKYFHEQSR